MSQEGFLTFFTTREHRHPDELIRSSFALIGTEKAWLTRRSRMPDRSWDSWRVQYDSNFKRGPLMPEEFDKRWERFGENLPLDRVVTTYKPSLLLAMQFTTTKLGDQMEPLLDDKIPKNTRGNAHLGAPLLKIGWHDIWEGAEHDEGFLFGRAFFSLALSGPGTPNDWPAYRKLVFEIPEVIQLKKDIEAFAGPCEQCIYWSV